VRIMRMQTKSKSQKEKSKIQEEIGIVADASSKRRLRKPAFYSRGFCNAAETSAKLFSAAS
jgi:hypothetical protein